MRSLTLVLSVAFLVSLGGSGADKTCKEAVMNIMTSQLKGVTGCIEKLGLGSAKERADKMSCVLKCVLMQEGIIGTDGFADPAATLTFVERNIPENVREKATMIIMECQDAAANVQPEEADCKSYDSVIKCAMNAMNRFCL